MNFPLAVKILDFRHASEYLADLAKSYRRGAAAERLTAAWCHTLKHAGGATLLKVLGRLKTGAMSAETKAQYETTTTSRFGDGLEARAASERSKAVHRAARTML